MISLSSGSVDTRLSLDYRRVPDDTNTLLVHWCELTTTDERGQMLDHNAFATSLLLDDRYVGWIALAQKIFLQYLYKSLQSAEFAPII